ncbi:MAG: hypothetical protein C4293_02315 [Nitrospiraceae bacterium]
MGTLCSTKHSQILRSTVTAHPLKDELLTASETCRYLKVAPRTLYRYIQERRMPAFKLGKEWRFVRSDLEQWLRRRAPVPRRTGRREGVYVRG